MQVDRAWMKEQLSRIKYQSRMKIHLYPFDTDSEQNYRSICILCHHKLHNPLFFLLLHSIKYIYSAVSFGSKNPQWTDKQSDISFPIMTSYTITRGRLVIHIFHCTILCHINCFLSYRFLCTVHNTHLNYFIHS